MNYKLMMIAGFLFLINNVLPAQENISEPYEKSLNERQPADVVLDIIGLKPGMTIGEIGAGRGRYTVFLATRVGETGKVYANDIDEVSLAFLRGRCRRLNISNVETIVGQMDNPLFPEKSLDVAIMVLVYHMIEKPDMLLTNLKKSLKPGSKLVILDPRDEDIDREFGVDRSKTSIPTIRERVENSAKVAGYKIMTIDKTLPQDYIFILEPQMPDTKLSAADLLRKALLQDGIKASLILFDDMKKDISRYDLSEKVFTILGSEFIGAGSYPEALATLKMGVELYPKSSKLYGTIGEVYVLTGDKENAKTYFRLYLENGPDSLNTTVMMQNFDAMYEQMRQPN